MYGMEESEDWKFQKNLRTHIENVLSRGITLKQCKARWISLVETIDGPMVVKMFAERSWRHALKRSILRPRATLYAERAQQLIQAGIPTPVPVATVVERYGPLVGNSCVVYRYVPGEVLSSFQRSLATEKSLASEQRVRITDQIRRKLTSLGSRLAELGIVHTDLHLGNFLVDQDLSIYLLDLDSLRSTRCPRRLLRSYQEFQKLVIP